MSELWDDSVLINAFNNAVTKYKKMHGKNIGGGPSENEKTLTNDAASINAVADETREEKRPVEEFDSGSFELISSTNIGEAKDLPSFEENHQTYSDISKPRMDTENVSHLQDSRDVPESSEGVDHHTSQMNQLIKQYNELSLEGVDKYNQLNQLAKQYSELEAQRQNVLEQLRQVGYWDPYSYAGEDYISYAHPGTYPSNSQYAQWGSFASSSEGYQVPNHQAYDKAPVFPHRTSPLHKPVAAHLHPITLPLNPVAFNSHCQVVGSCLTAPCPLMVGCPCCTHCESKMRKDPNGVPSFKGTGMISPSEDEGVVRTAKKTAETARSSMARKDPGPSNLNEGLLEGEMAESMNIPPDLKVVLDAWYSAGFYTSKYLLEQSMQKDGTGGSSS